MDDAGITRERYQCVSHLTLLSVVALSIGVLLARSGVSDAAIDRYTPYVMREQTWVMYGCAGFAHLCLAMFLQVFSFPVLLLYATGSLEWIAAHSDFMISISDDPQHAHLCALEMLCVWMALLIGCVRLTHLRDSLLTRRIAAQPMGKDLETLL